MRLLMLFRLRHLIHVANFVLTALNCICFHPTDWLTDYALKIHIENSQLLCDDWFSLFSLCTEKVYRLFRVIVNGREVSAYVSSEQLCACVHACVRLVCLLVCDLSAATSTVQCRPTWTPSFTFHWCGTFLARMRPWFFCINHNVLVLFRFLTLLAQKLRNWSRNERRINVKSRFRVCTYNFFLFLFFGIFNFKCCSLTNLILSCFGIL